ncbi:MAG: flagella basal body P-ring formation protein FlgA [Actinobacteria bacterium]|nr:flagella basal body P-ring formation protein FlgA [Actinomycetota bacterium]
MKINKVRPFLIAYRKWIAAGLVAFAVSLLISAGRTSPSFQVVSTTRPIKAGAIIRASDVQLMPINFIWNSAISEAKSIVGTRASRSLEKNEPISRADVATKKIFDPLNSSAVAITLPKNFSAADLQAGDRVDVYACTQTGQVKRVARNALVLSQHDRENLMDGSATVSLAVSSGQVEKIASYDDTVQFTFVTLTSA